ncbi:MAG: hypothetical protein V3R38_03435, partial [bacterium]
YTLTDDDVTPAEIPEPARAYMVNAYGRAYILPVEDTGQDTSNVAFDLNTGPGEQRNQIRAGKGSPASTNDYWTVTIQGGFQLEETEDNDPDSEGTYRAVAWSGTGTFIAQECIRDWTATSAALDGGGGVDPATAGQAPRVEEIVTHEVGHLLGLRHDHGRISPQDPDGGVMRPSCCPANTRMSSHFTKYSVQRLRSNRKPQ